MQDFNFAQILSNLSKSHHFCSNFASILPKFRLHPQILRHCISAVTRKHTKLGQKYF